MHTDNFFRVFAVFIGTALFCWSGVSDESKKKITSPAGYEATWKSPEEGYSITTISKDGKKLSVIDGAIPVSFSPDGTILLVREAQQDDDCRHYLLNLAAGEYKKNWIKDKELRIGGRYVISATWSEDGKTITLKNAEFIGGSDTVEVHKHCKSRIQVVPKDVEDTEASVTETDDRAIVDIRSKRGIGHAVVELNGNLWPATLAFRFHLGGLEGLKITQNDKEIAHLKQAKAFLKDGTLFPEKYLIGKEGFYQVDVSNIPSTEHPVKVHWVNFYR